MKFRLTGLGSPFISLQWEPKDDDKEIARRVLSLLEDRRILFQDTAFEVAGECIHSATEIRRELTAQIAHRDVSPGMAAQIKLLRSYFRTFMDFRDDGGRRYPWGADPLSVALGVLRQKVGVVVGDMSARFDLDVEDGLASIVPLDEGGFFASVLR